jgi:hypothetical protein
LLDGTLIIEGYVHHHVVGNLRLHQRVSSIFIRGKRQVIAVLHEYFQVFLDFFFFSNLALIFQSATQIGLLLVIVLLGVHYHGALEAFDLSDYRQILQLRGQFSEQAGLLAFQVQSDCFLKWKIIIVSLDLKERLIWKQLIT